MTVSRGVRHETTIEFAADVFRVQARQRPSATALRFDGEAVSFGALDTLSGRVAQSLLAAGVQPGDRVSILSRNCARFFEVLAGAARIRACVAPINFRLAVPEIAFILRDMTPRVLFVSSEFFDTAVSAIATLDPAPQLIVLDAGPQDARSYERWRDAHSELRTELQPHSEDDLLLLYTSGTTGLPKGVRISNANYQCILRTVHRVPGFSHEPGGVIAGVMPLFHVAGINAAMSALAQGCTVVVVSGFVPGELLRLIETERITSAFLAPSMILALLQAAEHAEADCSSLEMIAYGAAPIATEVFKAAQERFKCRLAQLYGLTESTGAGTYLPSEDHERGERQRSCGIPWPGIGLRVLDRTGRELPPGEVGEIVMSGGFITRGYRNREDATAEAVRGGWLHTGDAGYLDRDGYLFIRDRMKDVIVTGGENVFPAEVENAIFGCPGVADVAVIGVPSETWGEEVKAIVVPAPGEARPGAAEIIAWAKARIASYKAPKSVDFVEALPRNASGKILKRELRRPYWEGRDRQVN